MWEGKGSGGMKMKMYIRITGGTGRVSVLEHDIAV